MATRFYVTTAIRPLVVPPDEATPVSAEWDYFTTEGIGGVGSRRMMYPWRGAFQLQSTFAVESVAATNLDGLIMQYVSMPLAEQTITGTAAAVFYARENATTADLRSQFIARVIAPDGTVRGTLVGPDTGGLANEWLASTTSFRSARFPKGSNGATVTSVDAEDGDRLVVEVGWRVHNVADESGNTVGTLRLGGGAVDLDATQSDTDITNTTAYPWIEFSHNFTFLDTPLTLSDSIAGAPEAMPDPFGEVIVRAADFSTFTDESDDPTEFEDWVGVTDPPTGWLKMTATETDALVSLHWTAGYGVFPVFILFDEVPTSTSTGTPNIELGYNNPWDFGDTQGIQFIVPLGETWYLGVAPGTDAANGTWPDTNIEVVVRREDGGTPVGDIKDDIADAVDCFPATINSETVTTTNALTSFTSETDDPDDIATYTGNPEGYTGWMKLVVPETASVSITVEPETQADDLIFFLYDEVPTSSSVAIAFDDSDDPAPGVDWPYLPEMILTAGTYYLMVGPWEGGGWDRWEGGYLAVKVRWELAPTIDDFSVDGIIKKTYEPPIWRTTLATLVDSVAGTVDDATTLNLTIPGGAQEGDIFVVSSSVDFEGGANTVSHSILDTVPPTVSTGNTVTNLATTTIATNNHNLRSGWCRWNGAGDTVRISSNISTAMAAVLTIWRNAGIPLAHTSMNVATVSTSGKTLPAFSVPTSNANYGRPDTIYAVWAGGRAGVTTWTLGTPMTEIEDVSATANASIVAGTWDITFAGFVTPPFATPSAAEFGLGHQISIPPFSFEIFVKAWITPGFAIYAHLVNDITTRHDRTRWHFDMTPAEFIHSTEVLGSNPSGTSLHDLLVDLDGTISDLESGGS